MWNEAVSYSVIYYVNIVILSKLIRLLEPTVKLQSVALVFYENRLEQESRISAEIVSVWGWEELAVVKRMFPRQVICSPIRDSLPHSLLAPQLRTESHYPRIQNFESEPIHS